jgi:class 3 adenylate cyclase
VFILLQNLYQALDFIANRRKVLKVETIGDSYGAVTGCLEHQEQHAVIMARFATDCQRKMLEVTSNLCVTLGPDTIGTYYTFLEKTAILQFSLFSFHTEVAMRIGINRSPVTAGVLQGD